MTDQKGQHQNPGYWNGNLPPETPVYLKVLIYCLQKFGVATILLLLILWYGGRPIMEAYTESIKQNCETLRAVQQCETEQSKTCGKIVENQSSIMSAQREQTQQHESMLKMETEALLNHQRIMAQIGSRQPGTTATP